MTLARGAGLLPRQPGRVVQLDPIKPVLKAPRTTRLKLNYGKLLSIFAFKFNLRRYNLVVHRDVKLETLLLDANNNMKLIDFGLSAILVGRCSLTLSNPR